MAKKSLNVVTGEIIEAISLQELCRSCGVQSAWVVELVDEGILEPEGADQSAWRFSAVSITRTRIAWRDLNDRERWQSGWQQLPPDDDPNCAESLS